MTDLNKLDSVFEKVEAPDIKLLREIGKRIGFGRACQILGEQWDDMLEKEWGLPRGRGKMERRNDIEAIEAVIATRIASQESIAQPELPVKSWSDRVGYPANALPANNIEKAILAEIAELRTALNVSGQTAQAATDNPWHEAVYLQCLRVEGCYNAEDPHKTMESLLDYHVALVAPQASQVAVSGVLMPEQLTKEMRAVMKEVAPKWNAESIYANLKDAAIAMSAAKESGHE